MTIGPDFDEVLRGAREGAEWALEPLYRDLAPTVLGYLRAQGAAEPEDLASEVFVGVVRNLPSFRGDERSFRTWVFSIAHRRLIDERRRLARRRESPMAPEDMTGSAAAAGSGDVEEEALGRLGTGWAISLIRSLTDDQRAVVLLRIVADLSVADVAAVLEKSPGAVKTLQRRALLRLARTIDREDVSR